MKENIIKSIVVCGISVAMLSFALADTKIVETNALVSKKIYDSANLTILAVSESDKPAVVFVDIPAGAVVPPHPAPNVTRLITVISGTVSMGDGETLDKSKEKTYPAGSVLVMPPKQMHWAAARTDDVKLQLIVLDDEKVSPAIVKMLR